MPQRATYGVAARTPGLGVQRHATQLQVGGGLVLPPDYDPATDPFWLAQQDYVFSDAAGTVPLTAPGDALSWRSLEPLSLLAVANKGVPWDGRKFSFDGTMDFTCAAWTVDEQPTTRIVVADSSPGNQAFLGNSYMLTLLHTSLFIINAGTNLILNTSGMPLPGEPEIVYTGVFDGPDSVIRTNGYESAGNAGSNGASGPLVIGRHATGSGYWTTGNIYAVWLAPGRAFDPAQRAANEAAMAALCQLSWGV